MAFEKQHVGLERVDRDVPVLGCRRKPLLLNGIGIGSGQHIAGPMIAVALDGVFAATEYSIP